MAIDATTSTASTANRVRVDAMWTLGVHRLTECKSGQRVDRFAGLGDALDQIGRADVPPVCLQALRGVSEPGGNSRVRQQSVDGSGDLIVAEGVGTEAGTEARFGDALGVVVLVPEDRQKDHRLAVVHALGDRVVTAVRDHQVDVREHGDLRQELGADHVGSELVGVVLRAPSRRRNGAAFAPATPRASPSAAHRPSQANPGSDR